MNDVCINEGATGDRTMSEYKLSLYLETSGELTEAGPLLRRGRIAGKGTCISDIWYECLDSDEDEE
jgi:hypothetical protein